MDYIALVVLILVGLFAFLLVRHLMIILLVNACREGDVGRYKKLMALARSWPFVVTDNVMLVNCYDGTGLREAIKNKHTEIWEDLLTNPNVNPNLTDDQKESALHTACRWGNSRAAAKLVAMENCILNGRDQFGYTPASWAAKLGKIEALKVMLAEPGVKVNIEIQGVTLTDIVNESFESNLITRTQMKEVLKLIEIAEKERKTTIFPKETQSKKEIVNLKGPKINKRLKSEDFDVSFINSPSSNSLQVSFTSPAPNSLQPGDKIKNLSDRITWKISDDSDCVEQMEKETFSGDFMLTSPSLRPPGDKSPGQAETQSRKDCTTEVSENKEVDDSFELIAKAVGEAAEKDFIARKLQYVSLKRKKDRVESEVEEILEKMKNNMLENVHIDSKLERKECPAEDIHPTDNKALKEKLTHVEEELKKLDVEIEKLFTSFPVDGEMTHKPTAFKDIKQLGEILEEVELEELHTPRLVISLDPHPVEGDENVDTNNSEDKSELAEKASRIEEKPALTFSSGDTCVARWDEDLIWYNGKVTDINTDGSFMVNFVDYGITEIVTPPFIVQNASEIPKSVSKDEIDENVVTMSNVPSEETRLKQRARV